MDRNQFVSGVFDLYNEKLLESRLTEEGNICGCLLNDLTLYDDCGLSSKDFVTKSGRLLFRIGQQIRDKKCNTFDEITFLSNANRTSIDSLGLILVALTSIRLLLTKVISPVNGP